MLKAILAALAVVAALGCQASANRLSAMPAAPVSSEPIVWPSPPAPSRILYVGSISVPEDVGIKKSFFGRLADAILNKAEQRFVRPTGVAERDGLLYVADPGAQALWIFDPARRRSLKVDQAGDRRLLSPVAVAPAPDGQVFLADSQLGKVLLFDSQGKLVRDISGADLERPAALAYEATDDRLYVADSKGQQVVVYSRQGSKLLSWGSAGTQDGEFNRPSYLALAGPNTVLVTDALNYRVQAFDKQGRFLWKMGHQGDGSGDFSSPKGVAIDREGHLYVVDALFDAVQIFDRDGTLLLSFGSHGPGPGEFSLPTGAFIDGRDRIYVADSYNQRVQVFEFLGDSQAPPSMESRAQ
ncbi:MAG: 6-bladed beta-propeller [Candidatus Binataceae bacterium]